MTQATLNTLDYLRDIAAPNALDDSRPVHKFLYNTHIHLPPNFSAFESLRHVIELARDQRMALLGTSNYYDYSIYSGFGRELSAVGVYPLFGLEIIALDKELQGQGIRINDPANPGKMYICGKAITRFEDLTPKAAAILGGIRRRDAQRIGLVVAKLAAVLNSHGIDSDFTDSAIIESVASRAGVPVETVVLQERHVAQAAQAAIFECIDAKDRPDFLNGLFGAPAKSSASDDVGLQGEVRSHLMKAGKAAYVDETFGSIADAVELILEMGGVPSYPILADGAKPICEFEADIDRLAICLRNLGFAAVELIPIRNTPEILSRYAKQLRARGFVVTAGTEHNTLDLIPMQPTCLSNVAIPEEIDAIFREGACVMAAHQHLHLHGMDGYTRVPGSTAADHEARIRQLAGIGASLLEKHSKS